MSVELFGSAGCQFTSELREWLELRGIGFIEYDVEQDQQARLRLRALAGEQRTIPVLVESGVVTQVGWQGRGCVLSE